MEGRYTIWIGLSRVRSGKWRFIVNAVKNLGFHKIREISKLAGELNIVPPPSN
jgi:hypothetical protein